MKKTRWTALLTCGMIAMTALTGCGGIDKEATVATLDDKEIKLGVANFAVKVQQAMYDDFYVSYFGEDVWSTDMYGDGTTMGDSIKSDMMDTLESLYVLQEHMDEYDVSLSDEENEAIEAAAADFMEQNSDEAIEAMGAEQDIVAEYLTLLTIQSKMHEAIIAEVDTEVSDEEANTSAYSYVRISKTTYTDEDGNTATYSDAEQNQLALTVKDFAETAQTDTLETAAEDAGYTVYSGTFTADDESLNETVLAALEELQEGETSDAVETDDYYYVLRLDAETDEEATEETRESIISDRQSDHYTEVLEAWEESHEWVVDEDVWATVTFDKLFTTVEESTETEEATESVTDTEEATEQ